MLKTAEEIADDVLENLDLDAAKRRHKREYFRSMDPHMYAGMGLGGAAGILPLLSKKMRKGGLLAGMLPLVGAGTGALGGRVIGRHMVGPYQEPSLEELTRRITMAHKAQGESND